MRQLASGENAMVQVYPPKEVLEVNKIGNAQISEMRFNTLDGETQALIKKVAFYPEAFTLYGWAKRKSTLNPKRNFGDFTNYCIEVAMIGPTPLAQGLIRSWCWA